MKKIFAIALLCWPSLWLMAQTKSQTEVTPPGCIWLTDNIYIDETETANINWLEYLFYIRKDSGEAAYLCALPDTTVWANISDKNM